MTGKTKIKLSKVQMETLEKMEEGKWYSAYNLRVRISTLLSLEQKGLVERKKGELIWAGWEGTSMSFRKKPKMKECHNCHEKILINKIFCPHCEVRQIEAYG